MSKEKFASFERGLSLILVICVMAVSSAAVYRLLADRSPGPVTSTISRQDWDALTTGGHRFGSPDAKVRVVLFVDYECPFCRSYHEGIRRILAETSRSFAVAVHDFPLPTHPGAPLAAAVAKCTASDVEYGALGAFLYGWQDSIFRPDAATMLTGLGRAGDSAMHCVSLAESGPVLDSIREVASRFGVSGTPTVIIDRKQYRLPPSEEELRRLLMDD